MSEKICPDCSIKNYCFKEEAEKIASEVKDSNDPKELLNNALEGHIKIAEERNRAREKGCLKVNEVNPDYPGRNKL